MHRDIGIYKTLIENIPIAILVEDENRNITLSNQTFCNLFELPTTPKDIENLDSLEIANELEHLVINPDAYKQRVKALLKNQVPVYNELFEMKNGTKILRDFIPSFNDDFYFGQIWLFKDVTHIHSMSSQERLELVKSLDLKKLQQG